MPNFAPTNLHVVSIAFSVPLLQVHMFQSEVIVLLLWEKQINNRHWMH